MRQLAHSTPAFLGYFFRKVSTRYLPRRFNASFVSTTSVVEREPFFKYEPIEDVERMENYKPGGYHPIMIGDVLNDRYRVIHKLGHGTYSTIWLARDERRAAYVAIKVAIGDASPHEASVLRALAASSQYDHPGRVMIPIIEDQFQIQGPNGRHKCYVTAPAQCSLAAAMFCRIFKKEVARALVAELILAVAYTHFQGFVHGDIHLGNALIRLPANLDQLSIEQFYERFGQPQTEPAVRLDGKPLPKDVPSHGVAPVWLGKRANEITLAEAHLLLSDFGEAFPPSDPQQTRRGDECHAPLPVLPPEAHFDPDKPLSFSSDIWSLACAIWSIFGLRALFDAWFATCDSMTSQQIDILGPLPREWWDRWEARHKYFDETGRPKEGRFIYPSLEESFESDTQGWRRKDGMGEFDEEKTAILAMIRSMLAFRPEERVTAHALLQSNWMVNWGLPQFEKVPKI